MIKKIQGTDGIRREVRLSSDSSLVGLTPLQALLEMEIMTEQFFELYTYTYVYDLIKRNRMKEGESIVIGWDPRDINGVYTKYALNGIRKAGGRPLNVGIVPTPLVPIYMIYKGAKGGIMITASHNPPDQNGIKLFTKDTGLKPLPIEDIRFTERLFSVDYSDVENAPLLYEEENMHSEAIQCFRDFSIDPQNCWLDNSIFSMDNNTLLVVDPANGSYSGLAVEIFISLGFEVSEVSGDITGEVNRDSGVVELEGMKSISMDMAKADEKFGNNAAVKEVFRLGSRFSVEIKEGKKRVCGAVFDGDGDRFIRLDYNPFSETIIISSGDEIAFHQARFLMSKYPDIHKGSIYINTVESDINSSLAAQSLGCTPIITGVGDKWILLEAAFACLTATGCKDKNLRELKEKSDLGSEEISDLIKSNTTPNTSTIRYCVGAEESGHTITLGVLKREQGDSVPLFCGNGLKSAVNCLAATEYLYGNGSVKNYYSSLERPFNPGFKKTFYVYYVKKDMLSSSNFRLRLQSEMIKAVEDNFGKGVDIRSVERVEEPEMVYISIMSDKGIIACVYVRNSGTEDKTGINLRGGIDDRDRLLKIGQKIFGFFLEGIKDIKKRYAKAELLLLKELSRTDECSIKVSELNNKFFNDISVSRLLKEVEKEGLISTSGGCVRMSEVGECYLKSRIL